MTARIFCCVRESVCVFVMQGGNMFHFVIFNACIAINERNPTMCFFMGFIQPANDFGVGLGAWHGVSE